MSAAKLYTVELLAATVELANWPLLDGAPLHGRARSDTCGSALELDVMPDGTGDIGQVGMQVRACAVGQASAAIFARHAKGRSPMDIANTLDEIVGWLKNDGPMPDWPDLGLIAPAREHRGRHGAILLPWKAALEALSTSRSLG